MLFGIEAVLLCGMFWLICFLGTGNDEKNIKNFACYPDEAKQYVLQNQTLSKQVKKTSPVVTFVSNLVLFAIILFVFGIFLRGDNFLYNFLMLLILGEIVNAFDFLVIDALWWRNSKRIRFSGTEDKPQMYKNLKYHFASFLRGALMFVIVSAIDGALLTLF